MGDALLLLFIIYLSIHGVVVGGSTCDAGWQRYGDNCYRFYSAPLTWSDSNATCFNAGGLLATVPGSHINDFLTRNVTGGVRSWIGLHDQHHPDKFEWSGTGQVLSVHSFTNWSPGEPSNGFIFSEECVEIEDATGKWNDEDCTSKRSFVCMKTLGCDSTVLRGIVNHTSNRSKLAPVGTTLSLRFHNTTGYRARNPIAPTVCQLDGTWTEANFSLYEISCEEPFTLINSLPNILHHDMLQYATKYRVGSKIHFGCKEGYGLWKNSYIECRDLLSSIEAGIWDQPPICIKAPDCPPGWVNYGLTRCLKYVNEYLSWDEAEKRCHEIGQSAECHLASISDYFENKAVQKLSNSEKVWIGLHDLEVEGTWEWTDKTSVDYIYFRDGEPNNGQFFFEVENCAELDGGDGRWNDEQCSSQRTFVCEQHLNFP